MSTHTFALPVTADLRWVIGVFLVGLVAFHALLVWLFPLSKRGWKYVDYLWLAVACCGLVGATADVRRSSGAQQASTADSFARSAYGDMRERLEGMAGVEVCRTLTRNELPPAEFDATQREYNNVCAWARGLVRSLPEEPPASLEGSGLDQPPGHRSVALQEMFAALNHDHSEYRRYQQSARDLQSSSERNDLELTVAFVAPFLLATALALRITKVTGELRPGT